jgi:hypothetical protein
MSFLSSESLCYSILSVHSERFSLAALLLCFYNCHVIIFPLKPSAIFYLANVINYITNLTVPITVGPSDLRHEMSLSAQTLRSWVRIPLETWSFIRVPSVFVFSYAGSGRATWLITSPRSPTECL